MANIKSLNTNLTANIKSINTNLIANVKTYNTLATSPFPTSGLVAYYKLNSNSNDSTANAYNGTDTNISYSNAGIISNCASIAVNGRIVLPSAVTGSGANSISCWIKYTDTAVTHYIFADIAAASGTGIGILNNANNKIGIGIDGIGQPNELLSTTALGTGTWIHCVFILNGSSSAIYYNGSLDKSGTCTTVSNNTNNLRINGRWVTDNSGDAVQNDFAIDEVGFWNRALTSTEVSTLYNSGNGLTY